MANIKSLKPFQSGYDPRRNTNGRPKGSGNITTTLRKMLKRKAAVGDNSFTALEQAFIDTIIKKAVRGDTKMIRLVWEMCDGKPRRRKNRPY
jgi:hypothetical protein